MNQLYRALHMPPRRLLRKVMGEKEIYTVAVRRRPEGAGADPLPALGAEPYRQLPGREGFWYADPLLFHKDGGRWLFAEAMDRAAGQGASRSANWPPTARPDPGRWRWKRRSTCPSRWFSAGTMRSG